MMIGKELQEQQDHYQKQKYNCQPAAQGQEGKGTHRVHTHALGNKGGAPDHGSQ